MARRRPIEAPVVTDAGVVLPRHLADPKGLDGTDYRAFSRERREWFRAHGIEPGDWHDVKTVLHATWNAYGINRGAPRRRLKVRDTE